MFRLFCVVAILFWLYACGGRSVLVLLLLFWVFFLLLFFSWGDECIVVLIR